jgi:hypothetical protein
MNSLTRSANLWGKLLQAARRGLVKLLAGLSGALVVPAGVLGALVVLFFAWSCERQAGLRQTLEAAQVKKQAAADVSRLQARAALALREANQQRAQAIRDLESRRRKLEREAAGLRERLASLQAQELAREGEVATLPTAEVANRVAARLSADAVATAPGAPATHGTRDPGLGASGTPDFAAPAPRPALTLTDPGARQVETAFLQLDSCRQQGQVLEEQVANCHQQVEAHAAAIAEQAGAMGKLQDALAAKDEAFSRREAAHQAELKAARGSWRARFLRALEYFGLGVALGLGVR